MRTEFGNLITRLLWGGTSLNHFERRVLVEGVEHLPALLKKPLVTQIESCNLVQREADGRSLNFYRKYGNGVSRTGLPDLPIKSGEVVLLKLALTLKGKAISFHASLHAVEKQFFCVSFSHDTRPLYKTEFESVTKITESWRSNIVSAQATVQPAPRGLT